MDARQFQRIAELFSRARALPLGARDEFLDVESAGDATLRAGVEALLLGAERTLPFASLAVDMGSAMTPMGIEEPGTGDSRIGPYKLLEKIGEGGFGTVYMAEQVEPVRRKVALKVLRAGHDTGRVVARFEAERQALAMMEHPNITRVLDGGATASGRPYFVMELIRGVPITEFCDSNKLSARERLELLIPVCQAVQHAHHKGIIHRDLKPSNVLVTLHDGVPTPKVIDFGIAKALHQPLTDKTLFTEFRQLMGTPEYMSPEQAEMSGIDVDTRTDVYSLGVMLYELLVGTKPFDGQTLRGADYGEIQRILRDVDPPTPSRRLSAMTTTKVAKKARTPVPGAPAVAGAPGVVGAAEAAPPAATRTVAEIAHARGSDPQSLRRQLLGDLDWIVMKCLEKDRRRRYESASSLAADLRRYLDDEAVHASPPSTAYRLRKLARRHRAWVASAAAVLLALVLGLLGTAWGWRDARQQRDRAMAAHEYAQRQLRDATALAGVMRTTLHLIGERCMQDPNYPVRQMLEDLHGAIEQRMRDQPATYVRARLALANVYEEAGDRTHFVEQAELAFACARRNLSTDDAALVEAVELLACARQLAGRLDEAERLANEAVQLREHVPGGAHLPLTVLAQVALARGRFDFAVGFAQRAIEQARANCGDTSPEYAGSLQVLVATMIWADCTLQVEPMLEDLLRLRKMQYGEGHAFLGVVHSMATRALLLRGDLDGAERHLQAAEALWRSDPSVHRQQLTNQGLRADLCAARGEFTAEAALRRQALEVADKLAGTASIEFAQAAVGLANALLKTGQAAEAEAVCRSVPSAPADQAGAPALSGLVLRCALGRALHARGAVAEADRELQAALAQTREHLGDEHVQTAAAMVAVAELALDTKDMPHAQRLLAAAVRVFERHPGRAAWLAQARALQAIAAEGGVGNKAALRAAADALRQHASASPSVRQRLERALAAASGGV